MGRKFLRKAHFAPEFYERHKQGFVAGKCFGCGSSPVILQSAGIQTVIAGHFHSSTGRRRIVPCIKLRPVDNRKPSRNSSTNFIPWHRKRWKYLWIWDEGLLFHVRENNFHLNCTQ